MGHENFTIFNFLDASQSTGCKYLKIDVAVVEWIAIISFGLLTIVVNTQSMGIE